MKKNIRPRGKRQKSPYSLILHTKKLKTLPLWITGMVALVITCCDKLETEGTKWNKDNQNANPKEISYANRMEIPRLKDENPMNVFLVKEAKLNDKQNETFLNYAIEYNCEKKAARWVAFRWDGKNAVDRHVGRNEAWREETDVPEGYRVKVNDHKGNGYDRGHLLASEDRQCSKDANSQTFIMSNLLPQYHNFNASPYVWGNMEEQARAFYFKKADGYLKPINPRDTLYIVKGGTIDNKRQIIEVTDKGLVVPRYFFMAFLHKSQQGEMNGYRAMAFYVEHTDGTDRTKGNDLKKYVISIDELEKKTGIDFFCNLPDELEEKIERSVRLSDWGF